MTWRLLALATVAGVSFGSADGAVIQLPALVGAGALGTGFTALVCDDRGSRDLWDRLGGVRRLGVRWFLVVVTVADAVLGGPGVTFGD